MPSRWHAARLEPAKATDLPAIGLRLRVSPTKEGARVTHIGSLAANAGLVPSPSDARRSRGSAASRVTEANPLQPATFTSWLNSRRSNADRSAKESVGGTTEEGAVPCPAGHRLPLRSRALGRIKGPGRSRPKRPPHADVNSDNRNTVYYDGTATRFVPSVPSKPVPVVVPRGTRDGRGAQGACGSEASRIALLEASSRPRAQGWWRVTIVPIDTRARGTASTHPGVSATSAGPPPRRPADRSAPCGHFLKILDTR